MPRLVRLPLSLPGPGEHAIDGEPARYLTRVLRLGPGDVFVAFDPTVRREAEATLTSVGKDRVSARFEPATDARVVGLSGVTLVQCAGKGDKVEDVIRAATALGASAVVIATSERSVARATESERRKSRLEAVALDAARQSGRGDLPALSGPLPLAEALARFAAGDALKLCLRPEAPRAFGQALAERGARELVLLVGPEGGFSEAELIAIERSGFEGVHLGRLVLRTELAGPAALGAVLAAEPD